jgi:hypothetical protein
VNRYRFLLVALLAGTWALIAAPVDRDKTNPIVDGSVDGSALPPVLRTSETSDSGIVLLPGLAPVVRPTAVSTIAPPTIPPIAPPIVPPPPAKPAATALRTEPPKPVAAPLAAISDFERDAARFCQKQIGRWKQSDARNLLGKPLRERPALDEKKAVNGRIYAFSDPSGRNKELELDFDIASGSLRTVFAYPTQMTWRECLARWSGTVTSADAQQGRTFYSYVNRRLDVLVDQKGKVISLGMY